MNLIIAAAAFCNWQQAAGILQQLGTASQPAVTELATDAAMQQLAALLAKPGNNGAVVLYAPLDMALEHAAATGIEPSQAMALWQHNAAQLIRFCKQQRGKALLFNLADVLATPQLFKTLCAQHWQDLALEQAPAAAGVQQVATLYRLLGQGLFANSPRLLALSQQLDALAQPLASLPTTVPTARELNQLVADHHVGTLARQQLTEATQQNQYLSEQVSTLTKEKAATLQLNENMAELKQENTLLLEQLFVVQEELEKHLTASQPQAEQHTGMAVSMQTNANKAVSLVKQPSALKRQLKKRAEKKRLKRKAAELAGSALFNTKWYLEKYPDVAADNTFSQNPALHYLTCGGFEGRNPSPHFNSQDYLNANPDVAAAGFNPLYHYLRFGEAENRQLY